MMLGAAAALVVLLALGAMERHRRDRGHRTVPIRIHVNGTRGKSTVTRLVAAALREAGIPTLAKTTGTEARLILPDGREETIRRWTRPSIREQLWVLRRAERLGVRALVVECMAIDPDLQLVSEQEMIRSTIGVITNARHDHGDVMGTSLEEVTESLAATIPSGGTLVTGTDPFGIWRQRAERSGTRFITTTEDTDEPAGDVNHEWQRANIALTLAVTRQLGIPDDVARRGIRNASPDPGATCRSPLRVGGFEHTLIDATAANDPDSLLLILGEAPMRPGVFVFHHRLDRPFRLRQFADARPWAHPNATLLITGDRPDWQTWRRVKRSLAPGHAAVVAPQRLATALTTALAAGSAAIDVICCGNTKGFDVAQLRADIQQG